VQVPLWKKASKAATPGRDNLLADKIDPTPK